MSGLTLPEILTKQFYDWEIRGRGWLTYPYCVPLEPPFREFVRVSSLPVRDDGLRPGRLAAFLAGLRGSSTAAPVEPPVEEEPELDECFESLVEILVSPLADARVPPTALSGFLRALAVTGRPIAFEALGGEKRVEIRLAVAPGDAEHVVTQLRASLPEAIVTRARQPLAERWAESGDYVAAIEFGLASEFMVPLAHDLIKEPLLPILATLGTLASGELGLFQVLFQETRSPWPLSILRAVTNERGQPFFADAPEITGLARQKVNSPLFAAVIRVASCAGSAARAEDIARRLAAGLAQFGSPLANEFIPLRSPDLKRLAADVVARTTHRTGMLLSVDELQPLVAIPGADVKIPELWRGGRSKLAPGEVRGVGCHLGCNETEEGTSEIRLPLEAKVKHVHVIGASGTGKSTLLIRMILEDIAAGYGVGVLDPHGDLADEVTARLPQSRLDEVVLFDPSDETTAVGWNILGAPSQREKDLLASDLVGVFRRLSTSWGDQMTAVLGNAILVFLESDRGGTLLDLRRFLIDGAFRKEMLATVTDSYLASFWHTEFPLLAGRRPEVPILTRLDMFLRSKLVRGVVTATPALLDFQAITDRSQIFLGKLASGAIGEENAALLGSLIVSKIHQVTLAREGQPLAARRPFFLYLDEFHTMATPSMAALFSGARKYRLGITVAHQDLHQLHHAIPEVERAILANAYTRVCFRVGEDDARNLARGLAFFTAEDLMSLRTGAAICRVGGRDGDFNLRVAPLAPLTAEDAAARRREVRERVAARLPQSQPETAQPELPIAASELRSAPSRDAEPSASGTAARDKPSPSVGKAASLLNKAALDYLQHVATEPLMGVRERNTALGLSAWRGERLKGSILSEGLASEVVMNPGGRGERFKLLELRAEGRALLASYGIASPAGHGRGGIAHQWWVARLADWLTEKGLTPRIEDESMGARVDLSFETSGETVALEVEMTLGHVHENLRKDLEAGFDRVICLVDESVGADAARKKLGPLPDKAMLGELRSFEATLAHLFPNPSSLRAPNQNTEPRRRRTLMREAVPLATAALEPSGALSTPLAAEYLGLSPATLETMRTRGGGPRFVKLGRRVVYRREDLDAWLARGQRSSTSDPGDAE